MTTTTQNFSEYDEITPADFQGWYDSTLWSLRMLHAGFVVLSKTEEEFTDMVIEDNEVFDTSVELLKMLIIDEKYALHRAKMASCAKNRIIKALAARSDPSTMDRLKDEINFDHIVEVPEIEKDYVNAIRPDKITVH